MKKCFASIVSFTMLALLSACNTNPVPAEAPLDPNQGKSYFFLEENFYREYEVREITQTAVDDGNGTFTKDTTYLVREEIREAYEAGDAEKAHVIRRYVWIEGNESEIGKWVLQAILSARLTSNYAVLGDNNREMVKMAFPLDTLQSWDRNAFNDGSIALTKASTFNQPYRVGFNTFPNASQIVFERDSSLVDAIDFYEVYADSIGMVHEYYRSVEFCTSCQDEVKPVDKGFTSSKRLIAFGYID